MPPGNSFVSLAMQIQQIDQRWLQNRYKKKSTHPPKRKKHSAVFRVTVNVKAKKRTFMIIFIAMELSTEFEFRNPHLDATLHI